MRNLIFLFLVGFGIWSCGDSKPDALRIATAANLQYAINPLIDAFKQKNPGEVEVILGSSGKLATQIVAGAPYDVFVSADAMFPNTLHQQNLTIGEPQTYAKGELVLWSLATNEDLNLNILDLDKIQHFAIANPEVSPYGKAAEAALRHYRWFKPLQSKLVMGENISQTNQFIISENAQVGLTAKSTLFAPQIKDKGTWTTLSHDAYPDILQDAVVLESAKSRKNNKRAADFIRFLLSDEAKEILKEYGYR